MRLCTWDKLPPQMQTEAVRPYYDSLHGKRLQLALKRCFDIVMALVLLILLSPIFVLLAIWIKLDSTGPVFYRQQRVTQYGKVFRIYKFRTMVDHADQLGSAVTVQADSRITRAGQFLRKCRLDEIPQLLNILAGNMTFVGTRPEVPKYVDCYTEEMMATLLLPAGVTSMASIAFKNEMQLLTRVSDVDEAYVHEVLPEKMKYNLQGLQTFSVYNDCAILLKTVVAVLR